VNQVPRVTLGLIRLANGAASLLNPPLVAGRLTGTGQRVGATHYLLRMFGIRTMFLGLDLLQGTHEQQLHAIRRAPVIHSVDALAAPLAGLSRQLPGRRSLLLTVISTINLALALAARRAELERASLAPSTS
jgi:hypothetical protein